MECETWTINLQYEIQNKQNTQNTTFHKTKPLVLAAPLLRLMYIQCTDHTDVPDFQIPEQTSWAACEALLLVRASVLLTQIRFGRAESVGCVLWKNLHAPWTGIPFAATKAVHFCSWDLLWFWCNMPDSSWNLNLRDNGPLCNWTCLPLKMKLL